MSINFSFTKMYGDFELHVERSIPSHGVTAIFGPSGSGKTSLLRLIAGLDKSPNGSIIVQGEAWQDHRSFLAIHHRKLAYVFQEASLFAHLNVRENLEYAFKRGSQRLPISKVVALTQLETLMSRETHELSGGEKQRVAIARALCSSPRLLLMDEPLAALDQKSKQRLLGIIQTLAGELNIPIIYVSHSIDEIARLADQVLLMDAGEIVAGGDTQAMLTSFDSNLAKSAAAESMIEAVVSGHDQAYHLTYLDTKLGRFSVAKKELKPGDTVRLMLSARDVSITREKQIGTSILNIFAAQISELYDTGESQVTVKLSANTVPVLAHITRKSASRMGLQVGDSVYLQAKSVALL